ncbi:MAG: SAM-dependent methyltransferase [Gammaproteobacteria bacterium]|nr:SAM-dependent methyltransferase [Gammaproteobacteria bacterium]
MQVQSAKLPRPSEAAIAHSRELIDLIRQEMAAQGDKITFQHFMQLVLYAPGLGYYVAGSRKLGEEGDFVTAPEISPLFSHCLAHTIRPVLATLTEPNILEVGAGSGVMAAEILRHLAQKAELPEHYYILELSGDLRERQRQTIEQAVPECLSRVVWLDELPETLSAVVLGNEVLDAMPVNILCKHDGQWQERYVGFDGDRFVWHNGEVSDPRLLERIQILEDQNGESFVDGYTTEINLIAEDWLQSLAGSLTQGLVLLIDYGFPQHEFYHPQRSTGTLMCHYRHHSHDDPFVYPGLQDITAHVDFSAMAEAAHNSGMQVEGYTNQASFLLGSGLTELYQQEDETALQPQMVVANQIKKLTMPHEMGELFKVIGFSKQLDVSLAGFMLRDLRNSL